jgi:hypothetical protein
VWAAAGAVILIIGMLLGYLIAGAQTDQANEELDEARLQVARLQDGLDRAEDRNWAYYRANEALKRELEQATGGQPTATTAVDSDPVPAGSYGDGVYIVGEDITPGTYDGAVTGGVGYWARLKATDGYISSIITNGLPRGAFVLTIVPADRAVELRGVILTPR